MWLIPPSSSVASSHWTTRRRRPDPFDRCRSHGRSWSGLENTSRPSSERAAPTWCSRPTVAGGPLFRSFGQTVLRRAVETAGLHDLTFHSLRHSFVAILVAAGCNVREVSEWAGHNSVAFTLTRYGGLFDDGTDAAVDRLDALLG